MKIKLRSNGRFYRDSSSRSKKMDTLKISAIVTGVLASISAIWYGFDSTYGLITQCSATSTAFVEAEYSDDYTCTDMDGNISTCTDEWSELVSPKWIVQTINKDLSGHNLSSNENPEVSVFQNNQGIFTTDYPPYDKSASNDFDFDNFSFQHSIKHNVYVKITGDDTGRSDVVNKPASFYPSCLNYLESGDNLTIKTWYGNAYSVKGF